VKVRWLLMGLFLCCLSRPPLARGGGAETSPEIALIEFLGSWETDAGEWIAPGFLEDAVLGKAKGSDIGEKAQRVVGEGLRAGKRDAEKDPEAREESGKASDD